MKNKLLIFLCLSISLFAFDKSPAHENENAPRPDFTVAEQNLQRAIKIADKAVACYFSGDDMAMARYFNPFTNIRSDEKGSIWMYTSSIEAVNAIMHSLKAFKDKGKPVLYNKHFKRYAALLNKLYQNADFYLGTFSLVSYTQTKDWTVYGVNRSSSKGTAKVEGIENVYDDQMWLVRELLEAYKLTGNRIYLEKAEYLTAYVLDGWDCTFNSDGSENGGITWGPGYSTKHSCSNGPMVSPLVWLHELYKGKPDEVEHQYIDPSDRKTRRTQSEKKSDYYLRFAAKIYEWQKKSLQRPDGVYDDMMGGCSPGRPKTETIDGTVYRQGTNCKDRVGPAISYNSGTMLSGAADLYRATGNIVYLDDAKRLSNASFAHFAKPGTIKTGYYTYDISGFRNWFNGVLMRGYVDIFPSYKNVGEYINSFQKNLDYAYDNFLHQDLLPTDLLSGWNRESNKNQVEGMFTFAFAAEYAVLARYELEKGI